MPARRQDAAVASITWDRELAEVYDAVYAVQRKKA
jgi:hypothetical protein